VALACYFGFYVWDSFNDPFTTTYAYSYTAADAIEADGFLVREEQLLPAQMGIVDVTRAEGEKVAAGKEVAKVHRDSQAVAVQEQLDELENEISLLDYAMSGEGTDSSARLDESILKALVALRASAAVQDYAQLEDQVVQVKSQVLKRDYTYGQDLDLSDLQQQRQELVSQYQALKGQSAGATSVIRASEPGIFSAQVDGYESVLTPSSILTMTPSQLDSIDSQRVAVQDVPGKLVTSDRWYFVTALDQESAQRLTQGSTVTVSFSGDFSQEVSMLLDQIGQEEDGRCVVVLSSDRYLSQTLLLRSQTVEIVLDSHTGLRLPKAALRMTTKTTTNQETGEEIQTNVLGVYAVVGGKAEFKAVEILAEGGEYYVVTPASSGSKALRAGDEVIVKAVDLFDGKLLEY
jgi:HPt (histidine-containing phosphotransfer) domain-containing protein